MNNIFWSVEETGRNQEDRDRFIAETWEVYAPYVLFSKHHWMEGMPIRKGQRWSEMVVYTQVQRSLFDVRILDDQVNQHPNPPAFDKQIKAWNIKVPKDTNEECKRYKEPDLQ
jgi:magnesium-dependent phosphatase 1